MSKDSLTPDMIVTGAGTVYMPGAKALVTIDFKSQDLFSKPDPDPVIVNPGNIEKNWSGKPKVFKVVYCGSDNNLPLQVIEKVQKLEALVTNLHFNILVCYGDGVKPVFMEEDEKGNKIYSKCTDENVLKFFEENNITKYIQEQATDLFYFHRTHPEIIFNQEKERKIIQINSKEASFSRYGVMNSEGVLDTHLYYNDWANGIKNKENLFASPLLDPNNSLLDLKRRMGLISGKNGKKYDEHCFRYVMTLGFPTPGRFYYPKPPFYALFESGWYDFACSIPTFKKAIMNNQMTVKYQVYIHPEYFPKVFAEEGITSAEKKKARIKKEHDDIQSFLTGAENSGKAIITGCKYTPDGKENPYIKIVVIENNFKGGEYLEDSEEVSNLIAFTLLNHSSIMGNSPGKSKTINGTEARELFIINQSLKKPYRDTLLYPFYMIKNINGWDKKTHFIIPNIELTTLDKGTGAKKVISQPANQ